MRKPTWTPKMLSTAALCMAMSFLLSYLKLFSMPTGGSITLLSMLPLMIFAWLYGPVPGLVAGGAYGLLQFIQRPEIYHWAQVLLDYPLAFAMLGLAGCFPRMKAPYGLLAGIFLSCFGRFLTHTLSGLIFFTDFTELSFFGGLMASALYNGGYMAVETLLSMVVVALPQVQAMVRRLAKI